MTREAAEEVLDQIFTYTHRLISTEDSIFSEGGGLC